MKGQSFYNSGGEIHADWLVIDLPTMLAALHEKATDLLAPVAKEAERARAEAWRLGVERRQMREEMARMREEMRKLVRQEWIIGFRDVSAEANGMDSTLS